MQILTKAQVKYCRLVTKRSATLEYCLGIDFQGKRFVSDKFFADDRQQQAIDYCQAKYLADKGTRAYLLISNAAGLTVWREDKAARIVGKRSPNDFIASLGFDDSLVQIQEVMEVYQSDRYQAPNRDGLIASLKISLAKIADLEQQVNNGLWSNSVSINPLNSARYYTQLN